MTSYPTPPRYYVRLLAKEGEVCRDPYLIKCESGRIVTTDTPVPLSLQEALALRSEAIKQTNSVYLERYSDIDTA